MVCNGDEDWWQYGAQKQSVFIGEWSVAVNGNANLNSFDSASDVAFMRRFYANQAHRNTLHVLRVLQSLAFAFAGGSAVHAR
mmetsp:Transcript_27121/g.65526  ORF Transcript_27121/g.65526 Transcript_27121/m.65526 type:complete len:82 (-) Transcript_27121:103-348(-)